VSLSPAKILFYKEVVQKLKFPNNSNLPKGTNHDWTCSTTWLVVSQVLHFFELKQALARKNAFLIGSCSETEVSEQLYLLPARKGGTKT
jgi:hypothetical protein